MEQIHEINKKLDVLMSLLHGIQSWQQKPTLNLDEAAIYLGIAKSTLYKHTSENKITYFKPSGKLISFKREDLDKWLEAKRVRSNQELRDK